MLPAEKIIKEICRDHLEVICNCVSPFDGERRQFRPLKGDLLLPNGRSSLALMTDSTFPSNCFQKGGGEEEEEMPFVVALLLLPLLIYCLHVILQEMKMQ